jgi:hypothetical protein
VLKNKERELGELEETLLAAQRKQEAQEVERKMITPLTLTHLTESINKKVQIFQEMVGKYAQKYPKLGIDPEYQELGSNLKLVEQACSDNYTEFKEELLVQYQEMVTQKEQLTLKLNKLQELECYEKYLTELQKMLELKEYNYLQTRQANASLPLQTSAINDTLSLQPETPQYNTYQDDPDQPTINSEASVRKRSRIFDSKITPKVYPHSTHKESSQIMQERSTGD